MKKLYVLHQHSQGSTLKGPFDLDELGLAVQQNEVFASDFLFRPNSSKKWKRIFEFLDLRDKLFTTPSRAEFEKFEKMIGSGLVESPFEAKIETSATLPPPWFFKFEGHEYGPFSSKQITGIIKLRKLGVRHLELWHRSTGKWFPGIEFAKFATRYPELMAQEDGLEIERGNNKRVSQRSSRLASVWCMSDKKVLLLGICIDFSKTGTLAVHHRDVQFQLKDKMRLYIDPSEIDGFWVVSKVVRVVPEEFKVGFYFEGDLENLTEWLGKANKNFG